MARKQRDPLRGVCVSIGSVVHYNMCPNTYRSFVVYPIRTQVPFFTSQFERPIGKVVIVCIMYLFHAI